MENAWDVEPYDARALRRGILYAMPERKVYKMPFCFISLIEHKSEVDYNVTMQIFRYMAFIWEDYEREAERAHSGISRTKDFRYPPVLPILFYDGSKNWTASLCLKDRIACSDVLREYIPDYRCFPVQLRDYSNTQLMDRRDELSLLMLIDKLYSAEDLARMNQEIDPRYIEKVTENTPEYLLTVMAQIVEGLLLKLNVPMEEAEDLAGQIKERRMGEWCANFKGYDVQETRRKVREEDIVLAIRMMKEVGVSRKDTEEQLVKQFELEPQEAEKILQANW